VFRADNLDTKESYAVKTIGISNPREGIPSSALREIAILRELNHPNVIRLHHLINHNKTMYLVMDLCDTDLYGYLHESKELLPLAEAKGIILQLLKGLEYLHDKQIMHRDLKPQNLLLYSRHWGGGNQDTKTRLLKIADFGLARMCNIPVENYTSEVVTRWYRAPELLLGDTKYNEAIDAWSVGCIMVEVVTKRPMFPGKDEEDMLKRIFSFCGKPEPDYWPQLYKYPNYSVLEAIPLDTPKSFSEMFGDLGEDGVDLLERLLAVNPADRISVADALSHPWLKEVATQIKPK